MRDRNFEWLRKRVFLRPQFMHGFNTVAVDEGGVTTFIEGEVLQEPTGAEANWAQFQEISTFGLVGLRKSAVNTQDFQFMWHIPYDLDPMYRLGARIYSVVNETVSTEGMKRLLRFKIIKKDVALVNGDTEWIPSTEITGANGVALSNQRTVRSLIDLSSLSRNDIEDGVILTLELESSGQVGTSNIVDNTNTGIEIDYVAQKCVGEGSTTERSLLTTGIE